ncbi:cytochrome P450 [Delitschia confertaspora ATCC 74209]|uniref:Cytochrome P450 n=1 Tax=Delitschia confertaspora ATCC 74209 TaxID=1513339 RepID=A0A9P4JQR7_9PLEO|nr:cytochrome P450 [Delitschia confertaspora ATCC 74209]
MALLDGLNMSPTVVALTLLITYPLFTILYNLYFHPLARIPGPWTWSCSRLPFINALIKGTIVHDFEKLHRKYGPILRIAPNEVTFAKAEAWGDIFQLRQDHQPFLKDPIWWATQPGQPQSLISAISPEKHAHIRKLLVPGFTPRALKAQEPFIQRYVNLLVERLREQVNEAKDGAAEIDIGPWFNFTTFDIFGDLGFGESFDCLQHSRFHPWVALLFNSVKAASFVISARYYPTINWLLNKCIPPSLKKMQRDHFQQIADKVERRLNWELERPDIMSNVIKEKANGEMSLPIGEINTTFMVLTTAGSETTATVLSGTLNYLVANPEKLAILVEEVRRFGSLEEMTLEAIQDLPYLNSVLNEGLRLCPPIPWVLPRVVPAGGDTVCGVPLPGGTPVSIQAYTMYRDPAYFHASTSFHPERWLPAAKSDPKSPFFHDNRQAVQPFSVGPRNCLGQNLAWAEMRLILGKLLWTFDVEAVKGKELKWEDLRTFLLVEKKPIDIRLRLRDGI